MEVHAMCRRICNVKHNLYLRIVPVHVKRSEQSMRNILGTVITALGLDGLDLVHGGIRALERDDNVLLLIAIITISNKPC
jgi:hypothetical protein